MTIPEISIKGAERGGAQTPLAPQWAARVLTHADCRTLSLIGSVGASNVLIEFDVSETDGTHGRQAGENATNETESFPESFSVNLRREAETVSITKLLDSCLPTLTR